MAKLRAKCFLQRPVWHRGEVWLQRKHRLYEERDRWNAWSRQMSTLINTFLN
jgi:hypothetical protein